MTRESPETVGSRRAAGAHTAAGPAWTRDEMMTVAAARVLRDHQIVFVGIGLPNLACNLARRLHAPALQLVYESGVVGAVPDRVPVSIGDPGLVSGAASVCALPDVFLYYLQRGRIDVGFLGAAQIDRTGSLNTTVIGSYDRPTTRLPGSGGACDIALLARSTFVIARQTARLFVDRVDFVTSPGRCRGHVPGTGRDGGPSLVITDLATYGFHPETGELEVATIHPGVTFDELRQTIGWPIAPPREPCETPAPAGRELAVLRDIMTQERARSVAASVD